MYPRLIYKVGQTLHRRCVIRPAYIKSRLAAVTTHFFSNMADNVASEMEKMDIKEGGAVQPPQHKQKGGKKEKKKKEAAPANQYPTEMEPPPEFIAEREVLWQKLKTEYDAMIAAKEPTTIKVRLCYLFPKKPDISSSSISLEFCG